MRKSIVGAVLAPCLVLVTLLALPGGSPARAATPEVTPSPPALLNTELHPVCWCPDLLVVFEPDQFVVPGQASAVLQVLNALPAQAVIGDAQGRVVAKIAPDEVASIQVSGQGTHQYLLLSPRSSPPATVTVVLQGQGG